MTIYGDADIASADWTKRTWDLPSDPELYAESPLPALLELISLPAWAAAPEPVYRAVMARLEQEDQQEANRWHHPLDPS